MQPRRVFVQAGVIVQSRVARWVAEMRWDGFVIGILFVLMAA